MTARISSSLARTAGRAGAVGPGVVGRSARRGGPRAATAGRGPVGHRGPDGPPRPSSSGISSAVCGSAAHLASPPSVATWSISWKASRPEQGALDLADRHEHRRRILARGVDPDGEVRATDRAGPERDRGSPGQLAVGLGHERRGTLVARGDDPDPGALEGVEQAQERLARAR